MRVVCDYQDITTFTKLPDKYGTRGLPPSADPFSGYIGVQAHTENVAFRNIRIKKL
jgi:hypothetical protein